MFKPNIVISLILSCSTVLLAEQQPEPPEQEQVIAEERPVHVLESDRSAFGLGIVAGLPSGLGLQLGGWNLGGSGGFIAGTAGFWGLGLTLEAEGGYMFDRTGAFKQSVSFAAGTYEGIIPAFPVLLAVFTGFYAGPQYKMLFWNLLSIDVGFAFTAVVTRGTALLAFPIRPSLDAAIIPTLKIGLNWFF